MRPCSHAGKDPSPATCRVCQWCLDPSEKGREYRRRWGEPEPEAGAARAVVTQPRPSSLARFRKPPCVHLGEPTSETRACHACGKGQVQVPLHSCAKHGHCTEANLIQGVACCRICPDRQEAIRVPAGAVVRPDTPPSEVLSLLDRPLDWPRGWELWLNVQEAHRLLMNRRVEELTGLEESPLFPGTGRGIVTCGGGAVYGTAAYVMISVLRRLGCTLPVEVWHLGTLEMDPPLRQALESLPGVRVCDSSAVLPRPRLLGGWELKIFAILHSAFREVLFLDADQVPAVDPAYLFDCPEYLEHGAILWPDLANHLGCDISREAFGVAGLPVPGSNRLPRHPKPSDYRPVESGQVLVDRSRRWRELLLAMHIGEHRDFWYRQPSHGVSHIWHLYGDKSAFALAFWRLGNRFHMPADCGWIGDGRSGAFLQKDFAGRVVFQHKCQPTSKWSLHDPNAPCPGLAHWQACLDALAELRRKWSGKVHDPAFMSAEDREVARRLAGDWIDVSTGKIGATVRLHANGTVQGEPDRHWRVLHDQGKPFVVLASWRHGLGVYDAGQEGILFGDQGALSRPGPAGWSFEDREEMGIFHEVRTRNEYRLPDRFPAGSVVVDIGAHIGSFTLACLDRGAGKVHAVEPSPDNLARLHRHLAPHRDRVTIHETAAWRNDWASCSLLLSRPEGAHHSGGGCVLLGDGSTVVATPIDRILGRALDDSPSGRIGLLKLDCEGSEWPVLATTGLLDRVDAIVGEYHLAHRQRMPEWLVRGLPDWSLGWLRSHLEGAGFQVEFTPNPGADGLGLFFARRD